MILLIFNKYFFQYFLNNNSVVDFKRSDNMNFKRKLLIFLISFIFILPTNTLAYSKYLIPGGENVGIRVTSDGVYIVGFYKVNGKEIAKEAGLKVGDRIISINEKVIDNVEDLINQINSQDKTLLVKIGYLRNNEFHTTNLTLKRDREGRYKTGLYVKDSITGIGTLTYINPQDNTFGALGHEIAENNTGASFEIKEGNIFESSVTGITKAKKNTPGEKNAKINKRIVYGNIKENKDTGIFGDLLIDFKEKDLLEVATLDEVEIGNAEIITVLNDQKKEAFKIEILSIDKKNPTKNFLIKITDEKLLKKTGGIIKGMSGSPIIQNGKLIGAVTHTLVDNPKKGYGISIIKMLESIE